MTSLQQSFLSIDTRNDICDIIIDNSNGLNDRIWGKHNGASQGWHDAWNEVTVVADQILNET